MDINPVAEETAKEYRKKGYACYAVITDLGNDETRESFFGRQSGNWEDILIFW